MKPLIARTGRYLGYALITLIVLLALVIATLEWSSRAILVTVLEQQGLKASLRSVEIEWLKPALTLSGLQVNGIHQQGVQLDRLRVVLRWQPLRHHQLVISAVEVNGLALDISQSHKELVIAGYKLPAEAADAPSKDEPLNDAAAQNWQILLQQLTLADIQLCLQQAELNQPICTSFSELNWQGELLINTDKDLPPQLAMAQMILKNFNVADSRNQRTLAAIGQLTVDETHWQANQPARVNGVSVSAVKLLKDDQRTTLTVADIEAKDISADANQLTVNSIDIKGLGSEILRNNQGQLAVIEQLNAFKTADQPSPSSEPATATTAEPSPPAKPMTIQIGRLRVHDSTPLVFVDNSLATPLTLSAELKQLLVTDIDTGNPKQQSAVEFNVTIDQHSSITAKGTITSLQQPGDVDINGTITGLDLRPAGLYAESGMGSRIKSGQLNANFTLTATAGKLDSRLDLDLHKFQLKPAKTEQADSTSQMLGIPIDQALNLLRDDGNRISLKIPVTGDVENPSFDASHALQKALASAITAAVINYYTPFGLVTVGKGLFNLATALRFEPIMFTAGSDKLEDNSQTEKALSMMKERPGITLTVCGYSNLQDRLALFNEKPQKDQPLPPLEKPQQQQLWQLAEKRSLAVKNQMVKSGIDSHRLVLCDAEYQSDGISGVEISL